MTVLGRANQLCISPSHPGQLSLLSSAGLEISTGQSPVMLCGWGVKAGMAHSTCGQTRGWQVKLCDPSLTPAMPGRLTDEQLIKAKFHYASWFEAGRRQVRSQIPLRYLVRTSFEPAPNQLA